MHGGTALGTGRGEAVSPVLARPTSWHWVVAIADGGLSTPEVYRELDRLRDGRRRRPPLGQHRRAARPRCASATPQVLAAALGNDLQDAALALRPALADTLKAGEAAGALAGIVSGSGPDLRVPRRRRRRRRADRRELSRRGAPGGTGRAGPCRRPRVEAAAIGPRRRAPGCT